ncbi:MAG TPA: helix-turn-helix domain-containing protein [Nocardioidaceae bacterium]|nr:helix-turn-helix domain-containing protein [Nocardioidaceae bacterium]
MFGGNKIATKNPVSTTARGAADLELGEQVAATLRARLPTVAEETVAAVVVEVPSYTGALAGEMGANIENAVEMALGGFLRLAERAQDSDPGTPLEPALDAAYALGRGEARSGRTMDALLSAYRVGARVAWRELSTAAVESGLPAATLAKFAELVFAYIDELSAASVAGHADELATTGRVRQRYLERLTRSLLAGEPEEALTASAERAGWKPPNTLTAVLLPAGQVRAVVSLLDQQTLQSREDLPGLESSEETAVLLVPDMDGVGRVRLIRVLGGRHAVAGPARPWAAASSSFNRALRALELGLGDDEDGSPTDTEEHLTELLLGADLEAWEDLRAAALEPLSGLPPAKAQRLAETLRSWLLHQGRRDDVAADLFVHAQTVRYRMGQVRELYGDRLNDPRMILELTVALAMPTHADSGRAEPALD